MDMQNQYACNKLLFTHRLSTEYIQFDLYTFFYDGVMNAVRSNNSIQSLHTLIKCRQFAGPHWYDQYVDERRKKYRDLQLIQLHHNRAYHSLKLFYHSNSINSFNRCFRDASSFETITLRFGWLALVTLPPFRPYILPFYRPLTPSLQVTSLLTHSYCQFIHNFQCTLLRAQFNCTSLKCKRITIYYYVLCTSSSRLWLIRFHFAVAWWRLIDIQTRTYQHNVRTLKRRRT